MWTEDQWISKQNCRAVTSPKKEKGTNLFFYPDDSEILETWILISSFKYFLMKMERKKSINREQAIFLDHCVILWEIPQRQNQYFKRDQNAVNHHTQTFFFTALKFLAKMHTTWKPLDYLAHLLNISLQWFVETFYPFQLFFSK